MIKDESGKVNVCSTATEEHDAGTDGACFSSSSSSESKIGALDSDELESDLVVVNKSNKAELAVQDKVQRKVVN